MYDPVIGPTRPKAAAKGATEDTSSAQDIWMIVGIALAIVGVAVGVAVVIYITTGNLVTFQSYNKRSTKQDYSTL